MKTSILIAFLGLSSLLIAAVYIGNVEAQIFDRLMNNGAQSGSLDGNRPAGELAPIFQRLNNMMTVNVPVFYDMVKNGTSMGINVLSGLVRVDRGQEAERTGLQGSRPLSVRVFGVPVYERGHRVRSPSRDDDDTTTVDKNRPDKGKPSKGDDEEELPIEP